MATENPTRLSSLPESSPGEEDLRASEWMLIRTHPGKAGLVAEQLQTRVETFVPCYKRLSQRKRMVNLFPNYVLARVNENVPMAWIKTRDGINYVLPTLVPNSVVEEIKNNPKASSTRLINFVDPRGFEPLTSSM